jgi:hypothetical protein
MCKDKATYIYNPDWLTSHENGWILPCLTLFIIRDLARDGEIAGINRRRDAVYW